MACCRDVATCPWPLVACSGIQATLLVDSPLKGAAGEQAPPAFAANGAAPGGGRGGRGRVAALKAEAAGELDSGSGSDAAAGLRRGERELTIGDESNPYKLNRRGTTRQGAACAMRGCVLSPTGT